ncbi:hypothetical protein PG999_002839 [Apiospora kogelbergensis]|uniref:Uncharacterized protein n=1 Tax=Apiospora kogelbergensis TaxID=1337665 RepID=A0AAW0R9H9_9PEZI
MPAMPVLVVGVRPKIFPFFQLPPEIRDLIYEFVLVEPPKYERHHIATCPWAAKTSVYMEPPPFAVEELNGPGQTCHCSNRKHLAILLVNRQIHSEGSCVLWEKNVFSFCLVDSFNTWCARIGDAQRSLLRYIAIYPRLGCDVAESSQRSMDAQLLPNLLKCTGLRNLDLGPQQLPDGFVETLARQLPHLKRLRMAGFETVVRRRPQIKDSWTYTYQEYYQCIWVLALVHVVVRLDDVHAAGSSDHDVDYQAMWLARARAVREHPALGDVQYKHFGVYSDTHSTATLQLPHEAHPVQVPMIGLPTIVGLFERAKREREEVAQH